MRDHSVEPGADQVIVDGIQTLGTLGMVRAHIVQVTRGMRDVRDGHGDFELTARVPTKRESSFEMAWP